MPKALISHHNFSAGVVNKALQSQTDLAINRSALEKCENMVISGTGSVVSRFGTELLFTRVASGVNNWDSVAEPSDPVLGMFSMELGETNQPIDIVLVLQAGATGVAIKPLFVWSENSAPPYLTEIYISNKYTASAPIATSIPCEAFYDHTSLNGSEYISISPTTTAFTQIMRFSNLTLSGMQLTIDLEGVFSKSSSVVGLMSSTLSPQWDLWSGFFGGYEQLWFDFHGMLAGGVGDEALVPVFTDETLTTPYVFPVELYNTSIGTVVGLGNPNSDRLGKGRVAVTTHTPTAAQLRITIDEVFFDPAATSPNTTISGSSLVFTQGLGAKPWHAGATNTFFMRKISSFDNRLCLSNPLTEGSGGLPVSPLSRVLWFSEIGVDSFNLGTGDASDAVTLSLSSQNDNTPIRHLVSSNTLQVFTEKAMYATAAWQSDAFTPAAASIRQQLDKGCTIAPEIINGTVIFLAADHSGLYQISPGGDAQTSASELISVFSSDLLQDLDSETMITHFYGIDGSLYLLLTGIPSIVIHINRSQKMVSFSTMSYGSPARAVIYHAHRGSGKTVLFTRQAGIIGMQLVKIIWGTPADFIFPVQMLGAEAPDVADFYLADDPTYSFGNDSVKTETGREINTQDPQPFSAGTTAIPAGTQIIGIGFQQSFKTLPVHVMTQSGDSLYTMKRMVNTYVQTLISGPFELFGQHIGQLAMPFVADGTTNYTSNVYKVPTLTGYNRLINAEITIGNFIYVNIVGMSFEITV